MALAGGFERVVRWARSPMTIRFCQTCGTAAETAAVFCAACGARLAAQPGDTGADPRAEAPTPPPNPDSLSTAAHSNRVRLTALAIATVAAIAILAGGAVVVDRLRVPAGPTPGPSSVPGASPTGAAVATATPGATPGPSMIPASPPEPATIEPPTSRPIATPAPGTSPALVAAETPLGAVAAFFDARGLPFAGTCASADPVASAGSYCAELVDDRESLQVHWVGLVGSEPDTWLLVAAGQYGWAVLEWAPVEDPAASPPF